MIPFKGMSRWFPSKTEIQKWIEDQEKDFAEAQNKNPNLSTEDWLERYIFTDIHEIFFGGIHQELYEWLARLVRYPVRDPIQTSCGLDVGVDQEGQES
jgi:hypothetical protein